MDMDNGKNITKVSAITNYCMIGDDDGEKEKMYKNAIPICENDNPKTKHFINCILDLKLKDIYILYLLWLIWFINFSIFINKDLSSLLFTNINKILLLFMLTFGSLFIIFENLCIIYNKKYFLNNLFFLIYFGTLMVVSFKSLFKNDGVGWQFHLLLISINLNLILFLKYFNQNI